jgi:hypothetical protein
LDYRKTLQSRYVEPYLAAMRELNSVAEELEAVNTILKNVEWPSSADYQEEYEKLKAHRLLRSQYYCLEVIRLFSQAHQLQVNPPH